MLKGEWVFIIVFIIIILLLCFAIGYSIRNNNPPPAPDPANNPINQYGFIRPESWSKTTPSDNPYKNTCQVYEFFGSTISGPTGPIYVPGQPTLSKQVLDKMTGFRPAEFCLFPNMIQAQEVKRTCNAPLGVDSSTVSHCVTLDGTVVNVGATEYLYSNTSCPAIPTCISQPSLLNVGSYGNTGSMCLEVNLQEPVVGGAGYYVKVSPCDPTNTKQIFNITRVNIGQSVNDLRPNQPQTGPIARMEYAPSQGCLSVVGTDGIVNFDPNFLGCTGNSPDTYYAKRLAVTACQNGISPGFTWLVNPSQPFCDVPGGCTGCTGISNCTGCTGMPGTSNCTGVGSCSCTGNSPMITPAEFVFVGNQLNYYPIDRVYKGLTGYNAFFQWVRDQAFPAIYYGGGSNVGGLASYNLQPQVMGYDVRECWQRGFISQYFNLQNYNVSSRQKPCIFGLDVPNCTNL